MCKAYGLYGSAVTAVRDELSCVSGYRNKRCIGLGMVSVLSFDLEPFFSFSRSEETYVREDGFVDLEKRMCAVLHDEEEINGLMSMEV